MHFEKLLFIFFPTALEKKKNMKNTVNLNWAWKTMICSEFTAFSEKKKKKKDLIVTSDKLYLYIWGYTGIFAYYSMES